MPKLTKIQDYLSQAELQERYRLASEAFERSRWQVIWLLAAGKPVKEVAEVTSFSQGWVRELARRYNALGPTGLDDRRKTLPGVKPLLTKELQTELDQALQQSPPKGGQWNGPKVAEWIATKLGRKVYRQQGWAYLQKLDYTLQQPHPHHAKADEQAQAELKKLAEQVAQIKAAHPQAAFELWTMDEHRIGLQAVLRRVYAKRGQRPVLNLNPRYEWLYLFGFVCPQSGQTYWLLMPSVSIIVFNIVLAELARDLGLSENKHLILVLDGAGWHSSEQVKVPNGLHLIFLPPYSPELQPAERLWPLTNEGILNRDFKDLDQLQEVQAEWCLNISQRRSEVQALTCYKWWPLLAC